MKANTPGQSDGAQMMWVDGALKIDAQSLRWRETTQLAVNQLNIVVYMPDAQQTQHVCVDDIVVWRPQ